MYDLGFVSSYSGDVFRYDSGHFSEVLIPGVRS
jgi:hypothetical protein